MQTALREIKKLTKELVGIHGHQLENKFVESLKVFAELSFENIGYLVEITALLCELCPEIKSRLPLIDHVLMEWCNILNNSPSQLRYTTFLTTDSNKFQKCTEFMLGTDNVSLKFKMFKILFAYFEFDKQIIVDWLLSLFEDGLEGLADFVQAIPPDELGSFKHNQLLLYLEKKSNPKPVDFSMRTESSLIVPKEMNDVALVQPMKVIAKQDANRIPATLSRKQKPEKDEKWQLKHSSTSEQLFNLPTVPFKQISDENQKLANRIMATSKQEQKQETNSEWQLKHSSTGEQFVHLPTGHAKQISDENQKPAASSRKRKQETNDEWQFKHSSTGQQSVNLQTISDNQISDEIQKPVNRQPAASSRKQNEEKNNERSLNHSSNEVQLAKLPIVPAEPNRDENRKTANRKPVTTTNRKRKQKANQKVSKNSSPKTAPKLAGYIEKTSQSKFSVFDFDCVINETKLKKKRKAPKKKATKKESWPRLKPGNESLNERPTNRYTLKPKVPVGPGAKATPNLLPSKIDKQIIQNIYKINEHCSPEKKTRKTSAAMAKKQLKAEAQALAQIPHGAISKKKPQPRKLFTETEPDLDGTDLQQAVETSKTAEKTHDNKKLINASEFDFDPMHQNTANVSFSHRSVVTMKVGQVTSQCISNVLPDSSVKSDVDFEVSIRSFADFDSVEMDLDINQNQKCTCVCDRNRKLNDELQKVSQYCQRLINSMAPRVHHCHCSQITASE